MVLCLISRHSSNTQSKQRKQNKKKEKSSSAAVAAKEVKRESTLHTLHSTLDSRRNFFAYICNVSGLQVFILICLVLICPTWTFFWYFCVFLSMNEFHICMARQSFLSFYSFVLTLVPFQLLWLLLLLLFLIMQRSATKWENAEEYTFVHSHSTLFPSLSLSRFFLFLCNANKTVTHLKMSKVQGFSVKQKEKKMAIIINV